MGKIIFLNSNKKKKATVHSILKLKFWFLIGFLSSVENNFSGNNGLLDQVLAMEWVNSNIQYFNGDVNRITVAGHSAGAGNTGLHLVSPLTKGMYQLYIIKSSD